VTAPGVARRDDGLALRALRVGVHPSALVVHVGTDVVVRTPARPDHRDGNVVDLLAPPNTAEIPARLEAARRLMEPIGVRHLHIRYELPVVSDTGTEGVMDTDGAAHAQEAERSAALRAAGCMLEELRVLTLADTALPKTVPSAPTDVSIERLARPDGDVIAGRRWYAASVLDRYAHGEDVTAWRAWDEEWGVWDRERISALANVDRAEVWLASRHGMPVATLTLLDDQDGLVVVEDVVTHPAHRRRGIARALLGAALVSLRGSSPLERVALAVRPGDPAEELYAAYGFVPVGRVRSWLRPPDVPPVVLTGGAGVDRR
jgi:GNAT superfamily N-acetyltransferase